MIKQQRGKFREVELPGDFTIWYSYAEPIGFRNGTTAKPVFRVNTWGQTTARHLTLAGSRDKNERLPGKDFLKLLQKERKGL